MANFKTRISKHEVKMLLIKQVSTGEKLLGHNIQKVDALEEDERQRKSWHEKNLTIIQNAFTDEEIVKLYRHAMPRISTITMITPLSTFISNHKDILREKIRVLKSIMDQMDMLSESFIESVETEQPKIKSNNIFIVHGHNNTIKLEVARTLERLGLTAIILHEQSNKGDTIIEKFEKNAAEAGFAVVLVTKDDEGRKIGSDSFECRPRQNVVFEMGFFIGKLGRNNVMCLLEEGLAIPSDIDGVVYTRLDAGGAWKHELVRELKSAAYEVDANLLFC